MKCGQLAALRRDAGDSVEAASLQAKASAGYDELLAGRASQGCPVAASVIPRAP